MIFLQWRGKNGRILDSDIPKMILFRSSFDCYTPLERPSANQPPSGQPISAPQPTDREDGECDTDGDSPAADESSCDSDSEIPKRAIALPRQKRALLHPNPIAASVSQPQGPLLAQKKYNIWTEKIREDSLTETMMNFGVNREGRDSRNVEWYDHTLGNRFNKDGVTNRLKRRRHSGGRRGSEEVDEEEQNGDSMDMDYGGGKRVCHNNSRQNRARLLDDLAAPDDAALEEVAKEIAMNLKEANVQLITQVTTALGREFVQAIYKETQRIEEDGGMMIRNNRRRRTSGGVFLFLVKHNDEIGEEKKREAFKPVVDSAEEESKRDEEIEELKKTLITQDSPKLRPRVDAIQTYSTRKLTEIIG